MTPTSQDRVERMYGWISRHTRLVLVASVALGALCLLFVPQLRKDTSNEAYFPKDHPAVAYKNEVKEIFGLAEPIVIGIVSDRPEGVFNPATLALLDWLTRHVMEIPGVDPERVTSLSTEKDIIGTADAMLIEEFFTEPPASQAEADRVRDAVMGFELYQGQLVSRDASATLIVAEMLDPTESAQQVYEDVTKLIARAPTNGERVYVAGEGATNGILGEYIDRDSTRMNPVAGAIIAFLLYLAYRTVRGTLVPLAVVAVTVAVTLGTMAALGVPYYSITSALTVILISISVCDAIHVLGQYYEEVASGVHPTREALVVSTMKKMWKPVTVTSLTSMAGFLGLSLASVMPPMRAFGAFACVGVGAAWLLSMLALPAVLFLMTPKPSPAYARAVGGAPNPDVFGRATSGLGAWVCRHSLAVISTAVVGTFAFAYGASMLVMDDERIRFFQPTEPIVEAHRALNETMDGTEYLDLVVIAEESEGIFEPENLRRIEDLQRYVETLPAVRGSTSIVDYIKQMNRAMNADDPSAYAIPDDAQTVAQYFLLYSTGGDPTDLDHIVDSDYRMANVRVRMNQGRYSDFSAVSGPTLAYIEREFPGDELVVRPSGRVFVGHHKDIAFRSSHPIGVALAFAGVWVVTSLAFSSLVAGFMALIPVALSVLGLYAVMGYLGIWLDRGVSMAVAIAIGLSVDFSIHTMTRVIESVRDEEKSLEQALEELYPSTGRALLFSFLAIGLGFGVLVLSAAPTLQHFGLLVACTIGTSFVASMTLLPALLRLWTPAFLHEKAAPARAAAAGHAAAILVAVAFATWAEPAFSSQEGVVEESSLPGAEAAERELPPTGLEVARRINERYDGRSVLSDLKMELVNKRGKSRLRHAYVLRKYFGDDKKTVLYFEEPKNIRGTAFLTWDYAEIGKDDDRWLYLPAVKKSRRLSASDRGGSFLGTDFSYEDVANGTKVTIEDYQWKTIGRATVDGVPCIELELEPVDGEVAEELGYGRVRMWVDPEIWIARRMDFWDVAGNPLKRIEATRFEQIEDIWTVTRIEAENFKTGHRSIFTTIHVDYDVPISDDAFVERQLRRGMPAIERNAG